MKGFAQIADYITGMTSAYCNSTLNSRIGVRGIIKKVGYLLLVVVGMVVDYLVGQALTQVGISIDVGYCVAMIITVWLIINELISILENLYKIGVPVPGFISKLILRLKNTLDEKTEE